MPVIPSIDVEDPITPSVIEHRLDASLEAKTREPLFWYNYLHYQFDLPNGALRARSNLDEIRKVSLFLPEGMKVTDADAQRVMGYLTLRYHQVDLFAGKDGYVSIWPKSAPQHEDPE